MQVKMVSRSNPIQFPRLSLYTRLHACNCGNQSGRDDPRELNPCHAARYSRGIVQVISRRLPTAASRVRSQVKSCGICGGQSGIGAGFLCQFPVLILLAALYSFIVDITGSICSLCADRLTSWS
jgi:hypothetical protein